MPTPAEVFGTPPKVLTKAEASAILDSQGTLFPEAPLKMPVPDGRLIVRSIHGVDHVFQYADMPHHWRPTSHGIKISRVGSWLTITWHQVFSYEAFGNSPEFGRAKERYDTWAASQVTKKEDESCDG